MVIYNDYDLEQMSQKTRIIEKFINKKISIDEMISLFNRDRSTIYRMVDRYKHKWPPWLLHGLKWKPSNHQWDNTKYADIKTIIRKNDKLRDFWPTALKDYLDEEFSIDICKKTLRQIMIKEWIWIAHESRKKIKHQKRERRPSYWDLIQFDWSYHDWLENWEKRCLLVAIDDATSKIYAKFSERERLEDVISFWKTYFDKFWKPSAIYLDKHATYKVNYPSDLRNKEYRTRFQVWMSKLWIEVIYANHPEWKWRVERGNRTLQDRLIKKMRLAWIKTIEEWNKFLEEVYIPWHNTKFWVPPKCEWNAHVKITKNEKDNFYWFFAKEETRIWRRDWTLTYYWKEFQLEKNLILSSRKIIVKETIKWDIRL